MVRNVHRLTAVAVKHLRKPGLYADGGGLYLLVTGKNARSWVFRFSRGGKAARQGLGSAATLTLAQAREAAARKQAALAAGDMPAGQRELRRREHAKVSPKTFRQCAEEYIGAHASSWKNPKHRAQWSSTLETYAYPVFKDIPVDQIDLRLVLRVLKPIWNTKPETASRVRGRIETVLASATVSGERHGENPARWKGHLDNLLPKRSKVRKVRHHPALPYRDLGAFMAALRTQEGTAARALEFTILTIARTSEVTGAKPAELDSAVKVWIVPEGRIKGGKEHRVPLSASAAAITKQALRQGGEFIFPGGKARKPLSENAMLALLKRMDRGDITVHGFRSTFRDWAAEQTNYPREVAEMALAHVVDDKTEAAYRRGDLLEKRQRLMDDWAKFCSTERKVGAVVPINRAKRK